ncbi:MAG: hypothetical protein Q9195_007174 [Heterodermia aff. obscurata]
MGPSLQSLSNELHLSIFKCLNDLDDARDFARTCRHFSQLHQANKKLIAQSIVLNSDVYAYDICLSAFSLAVSELSNLFRVTPDVFWEPTTRPEEDLFLDCINIPHTSSSLTDERLTDICLRWQRTRVFRNLPLDLNHYVSEYETFRQNLASMPKSRGSYAILDSTNFPHLIASERLPLPPTTHDPSFIARFHKALCLAYLAVLARRLASASITTNGILARIGLLDSELWAPHTSITICGHELQLTLRGKVDRLEVFDLLYHFVLGKIFHPDLLNAWIRACARSYLFDCYADPECEIFALGRQGMLDTFRWHCTPEDVLGNPFPLFWEGGAKLTHIAELIQLPSPQHKEAYFGRRGAFDLGDPTHMEDFHSSYERRTIIDNLGVRREMKVREPGRECWWDRFRANAGAVWENGFDWRGLSDHDEHR